MCRKQTTTWCSRYKYCSLSVLGFFFFPFISQMECQPSVLEVELLLPLLTDLSFHWAPMVEHHLEEKVAEAQQEKKKKRQSCGRAKDVPEDVSELVSETEARGISTEITRTHQLEAERNQLAIRTGNNGGGTKRTNRARMNKPADTWTTKPRQEKEHLIVSHRGFGTVFQWLEDTITKMVKWRQNRKAEEDK